MDTGWTEDGQVDGQRLGRGGTGGCQHDRSDFSGIFSASWLPSTLSRVESASDFLIFDRDANIMLISHLSESDRWEINMIFEMGRGRG